MNNSTKMPFYYRIGFIIVFFVFMGFIPGVIFAIGRSEYQKGDQSKAIPLFALVIWFIQLLLTVVLVMSVVLGVNSIRKATFVDLTGEVITQPQESIDYRGKEELLLEQLNQDFDENVNVTDLSQENGVVHLSVEIFNVTLPDGRKYSSQALNNAILFPILVELIHVGYIGDDFVALHITITGDQAVEMTLDTNDLVGSGYGSYFDLSRFV